MTGSVVRIEPHQITYYQNDVSEFIDVDDLGEDTFIVAEELDYGLYGDTLIQFFDGGMSLKNESDREPRQFQKCSRVMPAPSASDWDL